jgi:hypothetical protein
MLSELSLLGLSSLKGGRIGFYLAHGVGTIDAFTTYWTLKILEVRDDIGCRAVFVPPIATHFLNVVATAGRATLNHEHVYDYKALLDEIRK